MQLLLDQYYLEPGYLWSAGSFSECSSLCGSGVARRSITCISKLLEQVEDVRCSNRSKPLAEVPCLNLSQCSYEWEVGPYSECLTGCGQGLRRRPVSCRRSDSVTVEAAKCLGSAPVGEEVLKDERASLRLTACAALRQLLLLLLPLDPLRLGSMLQHLRAWLAVPVGDVRAVGRGGGGGGDVRGVEAEDLPSLHGSVGL